MNGPGGNNLKTGIVSEIDAKKAKCRVRFPDFDNLESYWLPVMVAKSGKDKAYWMPDKEEHVVCLMDDNAEFGVIVGAIYNDKDKPPVDDKNKRHVRFQDGSWLEFDRASGKVSGKINGDVELEISGTAKVTCQTVQIVGNVQVTGNISATGSIIDGGGNTNHHSH